MLLQKVECSEAAYLKMGIFGNTSAGKTWTSTSVALGLHKLIGSQKGVAFFDTETGSDPMLPRFKKAGVELFRFKSRAFADLTKILIEAPQVADILIIDSITHVWRELVDAYLGNKKFLDIRDWGPLKKEWAAGYTTRYLNSPLHIIMCGRAGNVYENIAEEENSRKFNAVKVGTKMSGEAETGYEPSLLVEMEREYLHDGGKYVNRATVIKDRYGIIDGQVFDFSPADPPGRDFACFLPHVQMLNLGGAHVGVDSSRTSAQLFTPQGPSFAERKKAQQVLWEEVEGVKSQYLPGSTQKEKNVWAVALEVAFGTMSETAIQDRKPEVLQEGRDLLRYLIPWVLENLEHAPKNTKEAKTWMLGEAQRWTEDRIAEAVALPEDDLPDPAVQRAAVVAPPEDQLVLCSVRSRRTADGN